MKKKKIRKKKKVKYKKKISIEIGDDEENEDEMGKLAGDILH